MFRLFGLLLVGLVLAGCGPRDYSHMSDNGVCYSNNKPEIKKRNLNCSIIFNRANQNPTVFNKNINLTSLSVQQLCEISSGSSLYKKYRLEAKRRGLSCGVAKAQNKRIAASSSNGKQPGTPTSTKLLAAQRKLEKSEQPLTVNCERLSHDTTGWKTFTDFETVWPKSLSYGYHEFANTNDNSGDMILVKKYGTGWVKTVRLSPQKGLDFSALDTGIPNMVGSVKPPPNDDVPEPASARYACNIGPKTFQEARGNTHSSAPASTWTEKTKSNTPTSAELLAAQRKAEELEQQLATLKAQQEQQQQTISNDTKLPTITIASATTTGAQAIIRGRVNDNTGVAELRVDGKTENFDSNGNFSVETYVPEGGTSVNIKAIDLAGFSSTISVRVDRATEKTASISFERLNPLKRKALPNKDAIALIIGIAKYKNTENSAYADKDALVFRDYATEKLGIPDNQIKTLINEKAEIGEVLLSIRKWIRRSTKTDKTDVYVFYAGHGIATATGDAYILPYDGRPEVDLLDRTALLQKELFAEIDKAKPRTVTIFLDACYTGKARTGEVLMADANYRPIAIRPIDDGMPDNFTLITASSGDEFSGPLEEAKHGLFSYFLMKGMEGEADSNQDKKITAGELHQFVKEHVLRQSADKQTPELQGDTDRVLVRFQ